MKISKNQIRKMLLSETQRAVGLPHDLDLENFQADNALIQRSREIYSQYGQKDPSGKDPYNPRYNEYNLPPEGDMIYKILRSRYIQLGQLQNSTVPGSTKIKRRIARHRQNRLYHALELFGGANPNHKYYVHGGPFSSDKKAGEYDSDWLVQYQEILAGGGPDHITVINENISTTKKGGGVKITESKLRSVIRESIIKESQVALGIPHGVDLKNRPEILYAAAMSFLGNNPNLGPNSPSRANAELLMRILNNTIQGSVQYSQAGEGDWEMLHSGDVEGYIASKGHQTTPEETERMKEEQGKLKMVQRALGQAMGQDMAVEDRYQSWRSSQRDFFRSNPNYQPGDNDDY